MRTYGLIGYPLGHSFSRQFFTRKFAQEGKTEQYLNFEINPVDEVIRVIHEHPELAGLNVTIPYKTKIIPYIDILDETSGAIGAVNTIKIERPKPGKILLKGFNTDVFGFTNSLKPLLRPHHTHALVLGTGGASRAVIHALEKLEIRCLVVSRKLIPGETISYADLTQELMNTYTLIINTTPLGTFPDSGNCPDIPYEYLSCRHLLYDLVYNPPETRFMQLGRIKKASVRNGYEMLELQALKSYEIWNTD